MIKPNFSIPWENLARRYSRYYIYLEPVMRDPLVRGYFSFVASLILIAFFLVFALSPTITTVLTLQKKIAEQKTTIAAMDQKITDIIMAQENFAQIQGDLPMLALALPEVPSPQTIIAGVMQSASDFGLQVTQLTFRDLPLSKDVVVASADQVSESLGVVVIDFSFTVSGTSADVREFLGSLENLSRQIKITNLTLSEGKTVGSVNSVSVRANSYYLPSKTYE